MKNFAKWTALALLVAAVLVMARAPLFWTRYATLAWDGSHRPSLYYPRERVPGGNQPPAPRESPQSEQLDPGSLEAAARYAQTHASQAFIVTRHGYLVFERYWHGTNIDSPVESPALGRIVAALLAGRAIADRKIGWPDEPVARFLPPLRDDPRGAITVRNLLQLSSGLAPAAGGFGPRSAAMRERFGTDLLGGSLRQPLAAAPGTKWLDQSADPNLLEAVIENATGERYSQYLSRTIWQPIGAGDAWLWLDRTGGLPHADRGFFVRQGDWMRIAELLLQNGRYQGAEILPPRWVPQLLLPARSNGNYGSYLRLGRHATPGMSAYMAPDLFVVEDERNRLWLIPSLQIAILRIGTSGARGDWDDGRIPNLVIGGVRDFLPPAARPGADLNSIVPHH
ncbi:MAG TPA: serine hydrolase [Steroidobacteraceae bacterium]